MSDTFIYYVYAYLRKDGTPYYIGKGTKNRINAPHGKINLPPEKNRRIILENNLSEIGAFAIERRLIKWYGRKGIDKSGILLNRTDGGVGGDTSRFRKIYTATVEHRKAISEANKGKTPWNKGKTGVSSGNTKPRSEEVKKKISKSLTGKKQSQETIEKRAEKLRGTKRPDVSERMKNRTVSKETKLKISMAHHGKIISEEQRIKISETLTGKKASIETKEKLKGFVPVVDPFGNKSKITKEEFYSQTENFFVTCNSKEGQRRIRATSIA